MNVACLSCDAVGWGTAMAYGLCTLSSQQYTEVLRYRTGVLGTAVWAGVLWRSGNCQQREVCVWWWCLTVDIISWTTSSFQHHLKAFLFWHSFPDIVL